MAEDLRAIQWRTERQRYRVLEQVYLRANGKLGETVEAKLIADEIQISPGDLRRAVHDLETLGYLAYLGAGPRLTLTSRAVEYIKAGAQRRRSIRD